MTFAFKFGALVLVGSLLALLIPMMSVGVHSRQAAGGCHHGGEMPAPQPANFHCCQVGHNSAIVQAVHYEELVVSGTVLRDNTSAFQFRKSACVKGLPEVTPLADHPPGGLPLRI
jgi:hypothetical protein